MGSSITSFAACFFSFEFAKYSFNKIQPSLKSLLIVKKTLKILSRTNNEKVKNDMPVVRIKPTIKRKKRIRMVPAVLVYLKRKLTKGIATIPPDEKLVPKRAYSSLKRLKKPPVDNIRKKPPINVKTMTLPDFPLKYQKAESKISEGIQKEPSPKRKINNPAMCAPKSPKRL
jgi:hypothetical protein